MTIKVAQLAGDYPLAFDVEVAERNGTTRHRVTLTRADLARLVGAGANVLVAGSAVFEGDPAGYAANIAAIRAAAARKGEKPG